VVDLTVIVISTNLMKRWPCRLFNFCAAKFDKPAANNLAWPATLACSHIPKDMAAHAGLLATMGIIFC
jgi:hypothetical protein